MTDPTTYGQAAQQAAALAAQELGSQAFGTPGQAAATPEELAAAAGPAIGTTEADMAALMAILQATQARLDALEAKERAEHAPALVGTAKTAVAMLEGHGDPVALELGRSLLDAAQNAVESGSTQFVSVISGKLTRHLLRNPPVPGENYHYRQAVDFAGPHMQDAIDGFTPPAPAAGALPSAGGPAVKVLEGSVTG